MCGIVGVIGKENTVDILINGLQKLEYRGYDSAGVYVNDQNGHDYLVKTKGRIADLKKAIGPEVKGTMGIGHTRWATHGIPSDVNAHPHVSADGRFYLVHNGVINNYAELRDQYLQGVHLVSQTDTEVVVQLVDYFATNEQLSGKEAFRKTVQLLDGSYAFLLVDREDPDTLYVAKNKSPLLIGVGNGFNVVCSDAMAMVGQTKDFVELHDGELVTVKKDGIAIETLAGKAVTRKSYHVSINESDTEKGTYPFYMLKEIDEQPAVMRTLLQKYLDDAGKPKIETDLLKALNQADRLYILAAGTSYNAGLVAKSIFEKLANIPTEVQLASEFGYNTPLLSKKPFFLFLSQSGETADSRQVLVKVNQWGYPSLTITNSEGSTLSREATYTMLLDAGPEIAVASTKAYTAQIALQTILAKALGDVRQQTTATDFDVKGQLSIVANEMQSLVDEKELINSLAKNYLATTRNAFYIGRGYDFAVSLEAALKLKEISYVQAEGFAGAELKHGTISLIEDGTPVMAIITDKRVASHTRGNIQEVKARGAHVLTIAMDSVAQPEDNITFSDVDPMLTPLLTVVPAQLLAYYTSLNRGYDVDKPRNLAKAVTVE
ncbi:glutamine--fructose-6-phosphate transaminase (isomerizing) [Loigolactobacillus backii]|uniref:Glutamine--fructose-6-phosphate aminotransferase [isomerizing] n=1 Tax=Loigolactobacillus backii TaxID=375175 RepID=A0A192H4Y1_9LACO|nr:glutamine--fructose-6-phosphate transaminase (isomerizing) [Loigolactobacillus backii]ANK59937.1 glutamine--fructose-6-phosphate aminotransferase [Loigolactobacillus backii]ANK63272.1 glutamine--fructose-6-phosphate aminotransferase [Loigolactobacillus backii]ANK64871.1 glutamine--fructose-6-phosphate aminotransferase [Loigolactobacillus backii]ANK66682.1 glutamine--fructose-6-phosphate aminotransferase [Loigolactobacillus backii]ANK69722.1 glutamine--fructose-6-phosphate aminotransferase [